MVDTARPQNFFLQKSNNDVRCFSLLPLTCRLRWLVNNKELPDQVEIHGMADGMLKCDVNPSYNIYERVPFREVFDIPSTPNEAML